MLAIPISIPNPLTAQGPGPGAPGLSFAALQEKYQGFGLPKALVELGGKPFADKGGLALITNVSVELSSGFEASVASFRIHNAYDTASGLFRVADMKKMLLLGTPLSISLGYAGSYTLVFIGFVAEVHFGMEEGDIPYIEVMGMDAKGIMMAGSYSAQLKARSYGEAVREVLDRPPYQKLAGSPAPAPAPSGQAAGGATAITDIKVSDTPDKTTGSGGGAKVSAERVEMVAESDYEFIVKAAKKFNYEFFVEKGVVLFRRAKAGAANLIELGIGKGLNSFEIGYGITGLVETVEARAMDAGKGKLISSKKKLGSTISSGSKAKGLIAKSSRVYIDPTITSKEQADARVDSILEDMRYRLGSLEARCVGIPELLPGHYIDISGVGSPVANTFYLTSVTHELDEHRGYFTRLVGKAAEVKT